MLFANRMRIIAFVLALAAVVGIISACTDDEVIQKLSEMDEEMLIQRIEEHGIEIPANIDIATIRSAIAELEADADCSAPIVGWTAIADFYEGLRSLVKAYNAMAHDENSMVVIESNPNNYTIPPTIEPDTPEYDPIQSTAPIEPEIKQIADDGDTRFYLSHTTRVKYFTTIDELAAAAPIVIAGDCIEARPVYKLNSIYTLSRVEVTAVYKGDVNVGDIISVIELGGRTTFGDYDANCNDGPKAFEVNGQRLSDDHRVVFGTDGYYPLAAGESVLLFLGDTTGFLPDVSGTLYDIIGNTDGKLYAQEDGAYKKADPSQTDSYIFNADNLTVTVEELEKLAD